MISSPIQSPKYLKMFVGHIVLVNYLLSICFIQIAASNNNELDKEEDNGLNVFKERVKRGEETQWPLSPKITIGILVALVALVLACSILSYYYYTFYTRYNKVKAELDWKKFELDREKRYNRLMEAKISKMMEKDIAEMEKSEKMKRKAKGEEDEVYKIKEDKDKEDKNKEGKDTSRMAFI
ncbi:unnamed protein product [Meloidogyne enterolobii]|uniref:Uncharacterized protein n=1 Tax=Meloidogyne enterolobii TaxID=390850 RepID=A0ACB0ZP31_MELEN